MFIVTRRKGDRIYITHGGDTLELIIKDIKKTKINLFFNDLSNKFRIIRGELLEKNSPPGGGLKTSHITAIAGSDSLAGDNKPECQS